ncbi:MAG: restriction endonuclease subunit S [Chloroflexota bacterium]|nr:restriction endonuclease subunit S [Chloroflexota bacterium]
MPTLNQPGAWGDEPTDDDPGVRVLRAADLTRDGRVHTEKAAWRRLGDKDRERRLMQDGDLILERSGGGPAAPVGRIALIEESAPIYCSNFCQHLRLDATRCSARFAARALWHRYMRGVTERLEQRTTGIRNLDYEGYLMYPIPLPSMREQEAIADALDSAESAIESERDRLSALELMKSSTADALLSGQLNATQQKE